MADGTRLTATILMIVMGTASTSGAEAAFDPTALPAAPGRAKPEQVSFTRDIRPILARHCFPCHGPDEHDRKAKLRLDTREGAFADRDGDRPFVPGSTEDSEAFRRINSADLDDQMPPGGRDKRLDPQQVDLLKRWIEQGANWELHWSFEKPASPALPRVKDASWPRNGIDRFVLARLGREGMTPSPEADRTNLVRRVSLDLIGLPPTIDRVDRFLNDKGADAYERLVEELLASPAFGERWARVWLDLARYADTKGYEKDVKRSIWRYRDWVVAAFNAGMPYDRFTIEQLAGDLLPQPSPDQRLATAFHRNTLSNDEGGTDDEEFRIAAVKDRVDTTGQVFMGLTLGCAKCHSHKYDPVSHREYYQFYAFFNQTADSDRSDDHPTEPFPSPDQQAEIDRLQLRIKDVETELRTTEHKTKAEPVLKPLRDELGGLRTRIEAIQNSVRTPIVRELPENQRRVSRIHNRGNFLDPGEVIEPATPASFHPLKVTDPRNRLGIARWLMSPDNPLTARVAVNRYWAQFFGRGIVETQEDFGGQGQPPSHPDLLDWLACEFRDGGWAFKPLCRLIVTSATYRQSSRTTPDRLERDRTNVLLARGPRFRLEAEMLRDNALAVAGLLSPKMYGPSVMPYQPDGIWRSTYNTDNWVTSPGEDRYRRALYTFLKRTSPYPAMLTFDAPTREFCTVRRISTNTPLQALVTLNDPVYVEAAQALARRMVRETTAATTATPRDRIAFGLRLALLRAPESREVEALMSLYQSRLAHYRAHTEDALKLATKPLGPLPTGWDPAELAALTTVANVILNLDEVLIRG